MDKLEDKMPKLQLGHSKITDIFFFNRRMITK